MMLKKIVIDFVILSLLTATIVYAASSNFCGSGFQPR